MVLLLRMPSVAVPILVLLRKPAVAISLLLRTSSYAISCSSIIFFFSYFSYFWVVIMAVRVRAVGPEGTQGFAHAAAKYEKLE